MGKIVHKCNLWLCLWKIKFLILIFMEFITDVKGEADWHQVRLHQKRAIKSQGFPVCCQQSETILDGKSQRQNDKILITFVDLDIPQDSVFKIYDGDPNNGKLVHPHPKVEYGRWSRSSIISTEQRVHIIFHPGNYTRRHVGFKLVVWSEYVFPHYHTWNGQPVPGFCPHIPNDRLAGEYFVHGLADSFYFRNKNYQFDCIYQFPVTEPHQVAYIDFGMLKGHGTVEVRRNIHSEGPLVFFLNATKLTMNSQKVQHFESKEGLFLRFLMQLDELNNTIGFRFGVEDYEKYLSTESQVKKKCPSDELDCDRGSKCFSESEQCNRYFYCIDASDEPADCFSPITIDWQKYKENKVTCNGRVCYSSKSTMTGAIVTVCLLVVTFIITLIYCCCFMKRKRPPRIRRAPQTRNDTAEMSALKSRFEQTDAPPSYEEATERL